MFLEVSVVSIFTVCLIVQQINYILLIWIPSISNFWKNNSLPFSFSTSINLIHREALAVCMKCVQCPFFRKWIMQYRRPCHRSCKLPTTMKGRKSLEVWNRNYGQRQQNWWHDRRHSRLHWVSHCRWQILMEHSRLEDRWEIRTFRKTIEITFLLSINLQTHIVLNYKWNKFLSFFIFVANGDGMDDSTITRCHQWLPQSSLIQHRCIFSFSNSLFIVIVVIRQTKCNYQ